MREYIPHERRGGGGATYDQLEFALARHFLTTVKEGSCCRQSIYQCCSKSLIFSWSALVDSWDTTHRCSPLVAGILLVACQEQQERNFQSSLRYKKRRRRRRQPYRSALGRRRMHHHSPLPPQPIGAAQEGFVGCVFFLCGSGRRVLALSGEEGTSAVWWRGRCHDGWCVGLRRERRPAFRLCVGVVCVEKRIFVMWARCVGCARWLKSQEPFACKDYSPFWNRRPQRTWRRFCCPVSPSSTPTALRRPSALLTPGVRRAEARGVTKLNVHDT